MNLNSRAYLIDWNSSLGFASFQVPNCADLVSARTERAQDLNTQRYTNKKESEVDLKYHST